VKPPRFKGDPEEVYAQKRAEILRTQNAPITEEEAVAKALAGLPAPAQLSVGAAGSVYIPQVRVSAEPIGVEAPAAPSVLPWLVRFFPDQIEADVRAALAARYTKIELSMPEREKRTRLKQLRAELLEADRARCEAVWATYAANPAAGLSLPPEADPRAVLGIDGPEIVLPEDR